MRPAESRGERRATRGGDAAVAVGLAGCSGVGVGAGAQPSAASTVAAFQIDQDFPDPGALVVGDRVYAYATNSPAAKMNVTDKRVRLHGVRHTTIDLLHEAGVPEHVIMKIAGQSTRSVTRGYTSRGNQKRPTEAASDCKTLPVRLGRREVSDMFQGDARTMCLPHKTKELIWKRTTRRALRFSVRPQR